jgi:hypothetical protein
MFVHEIVVGSMKANGRVAKNCLGRVFKFQVGCFYYNCNRRAHLEFKTLPWLSLVTFPIWEKR